MKKKIIASLLAIVSIFSCVFLASCSEKSEKEIVLIQSFDDYTDYWTFDYDDYTSTGLPTFGDIYVNTDKKYITEGNGSMLYQVTVLDYEPVKDTYRTSSFLVPTTINGKKYNDFSKVKEITVDIYNPTDSPIDLQLAPGNINGHKWDAQTRELVPASDYVLAPNQWTNVSYVVDPIFMEMVIDIKKINWIYFGLGGVNAYVYVDNLRFELTDREFTSTEFYLDAEEICSFDKEYQQLVVSPAAGSAKYLKTEINTDRANSITGNSLKVTIFANNLTSGYCQIKFSNKLLPAAGLSAYHESSYIAFDVKKDYDKVQWIIPTMVNSYWNTRSEVKGVNIPAGREWYTVKFRIDSVVSNPDTFIITFPTAGSTERVLYFDNFRIIPQEGDEE